MAYEDYWIKRADRRMAERQAALTASVLQIDAAYHDAMNTLNKRIDKLFFKFVRENQLSKEQAVQLLNEVISSKEVDDIRSMVDSISDADIKSRLQQKLEATYYRSRISREEALMEAVQIQMSQIADRELAATTAAYTAAIREEYLHNIFDSQQFLGVAFSFDELPDRIINEILKNDWSGKHYSKRIWGNTQEIARQIEEIILSGQMIGTNSRAMAKKLNEIADTGVYACERLIRTETTYFTTMADLEASRQRSTNKIQFVATLDNRTSPQCREADGKIIPIKDAAPGKNVPPLHPFCRSVIIDVVEGLVHKVRTAKSPQTGENYKVPADMTYKEWKGQIATELTKAKGLAAGDITSDEANAIVPTPPELLETIDMSDRNMILSKLKEYEQQIVDSPKEVAILITKEGQVWRMTGGLNEVDFAKELHNYLNGAYITHNHPIGSANEYTFSNMDINAYMENNIEILRGIDEKYSYELCRDSTILDEHISIFDLDEYSAQHDAVISKAQQMGIGYRRENRYE